MCSVPCIDFHKTLKSLALEEKFKKLNYFREAFFLIMLVKKIISVIQNDGIAFFSAFMIFKFYVLFNSYIAFAIN
jgi:hypothetical protein